MIAANQKID